MFFSRPGVTRFCTTARAAADHHLQSGGARRCVVRSGRAKTNCSAGEISGGRLCEFSGAAQEQKQARRNCSCTRSRDGGIILLLAIVFRKASHRCSCWRTCRSRSSEACCAIFLVGYFGEGQGSLSLGTLVGFVTLFASRLRNSIMMISHFDHLVNQKVCRGESRRRCAAQRSGLFRFDDRAVTPLGLLPLASRQR